MAQDIRELMKGQPSKEPSLPSGHEARFEARLQAAFGDEKTINSGVKRPLIFWMKIAAIAIAFIAVSVFGYYSLSNTNGENTLVENDAPVKKIDEENMVRLADISPDLKKVEDFYMASINVQLASLVITDDTKDLINAYMKQLDELTQEYNNLQLDLNEVGPTETTINALIDNLKMRLELLLKLKQKQKELKNQTNEQISSIEA